MERVVSATEARVHFGALMRQVIESGEPIFVERAGRREVVVLSAGDYERLRAAQEEHCAQCSLAAPTLLYYEVSNVLHRYRRQCLLSAQAADLALSAALSLPEIGAGGTVSSGAGATTAVGS